MYQESVQLLSTVLQSQLGVVDDNLCKPSHQGHPCCIWAGQSIEHYNWLVEHTKALRNLYWKDIHGYDEYFEAVLSHTPELASKGFTAPPKCVNTDEYPELKSSKVFDTVEELYKKYLRNKYQHWTTRTDKRKVKVEFVAGLPDYMLD